jgi:LmbE family N-acetylglucosaminyl deacetylase
MCTSGDAGSDDPTTSAEDLVRIREAEQRAAAEILGLAGVHFLRFPDGELEPSIVLRKVIVREMRRLKADVVSCQDPRALVDDGGTYLSYPGSSRGGPGGTRCRVRDLRAEGFEAHKVREVWMYFTGNQHLNHWVDISETLEQKVQALEAHASQLGAWAANGALRREMLKWAEAAGKRSQLGFRYAEGFQRIVLMSDEEKPPEAGIAEVERTGSPRTTHLSDWQPYTATRRSTMVLGAPCRAVDAPYESERRFWTTAVTLRLEATTAPMTVPACTL